MVKRKTQVVKIGAFWKVRLLWCGTWVTLRDLHCTRAAARKAAAIEAIN